MRYRAEIDGLRAVAVIPVILFHAGFSIFSGGFVGVDVFFVISGFLITSIILSERAAGKFSIARFYERRVRRILPALFFVMAVSIPFAWWLMLPDELAEFSTSLATTAIFLSNIYFAHESGYFATASELQPMLHTWSLAIEEQYYVFFPLFLILTAKLANKWVVAILGVVALVSLGAAQWAVTNAPDEAFFALSARVWELLIGVFVAFYLAAKPELKGNQALSLLGLALICVAIFVYDDQTPFPSAYTLAPTVGVALILLFTSSSTLTFKILSNRALVGIGLISYSAYLWHQPIFAFARLHDGHAPSALLMVMLGVLALGLAYLTWRFVERPFRNRAFLTRRTLFLGAFTGAACFFVIGLVGLIGTGWEDLWLKGKSSQTVALYGQMRDAELFENPKDNDACQFLLREFDDAEISQIMACYREHGPGVALLGDSHATDLYHSTSTANPDYAFIVGLARGGCRPHTPRKKCSYVAFAQFVAQNADVFKTIVFEQAGFYLLSENGVDIGTREMVSALPVDSAVPEFAINEEFVGLVQAYLLELSAHTDVVWLSPRLEPQFTRKHILQNGCAAGFALRSGQAANFVRLDAYIEHQLRDTEIGFVSQNDLLNLDFATDFMDCEALFWSDGDHFSAAGERRFGARMNLLDVVLR